MLILSSLSKIQVDQFYRFLLGSWFPGNCGIIMGIVVSHKFNGMSRGDVMEFHEVCHFWIGFDFLSSLRGPLPGGTVSRWSSSSSFPGVSLVFGRMASFFMADEAFAIPDMFCFVAWGEIDFVNIHGAWVNL